MSTHTVTIEQQSLSNDALVPLCHIVTPVGMMGYGFDEDLIKAELDALATTSVPTAIILDSGSTDSGPSKLALGEMTVPRDSYKRDLTKLIRLIDAYKVPVLFSSAGGDGSDAHVDEMRKIVEEILSEKFTHRQLKVLSIYSEISKSLVKQRLDQGSISGCGPAVPTLTVVDVDAAPTIVAQMGCEPFLDAMFAAPNFDMIIGGRAYDPSPYVAYVTYQAMKSSKRMPLAALGKEFPGAAFHMGKIMECGGLCATPKSYSARATIYACGAFDIAPLAKGSRCTPLSVAAHTLYEKSRPDLLYGPGGCLDLTFSKYEQLSDGKSVRSRGATFRSLPTADEKYTVKLEGARTVGYRTIFMGSFRDPILIQQLDHLLNQIRDYVSSQHKEIEAHWDLQFHKYGDTGHSSGPATEVFIVAEALADTQVLANSVASLARIAATHGAYPGQKATSGNLAFGLGGKNEFEAGLCAEFCIYHVMGLEAGEEGAREIARTESGSNHDNEDAANSRKLFAYRQDTLGNQSEDLETTNRVIKNGRTHDIDIAKSKSPQPTSTPNSNGATGSRDAENHSTKNSTIEIPACETLGDVAKVLRSKNAGPFEVTMDVMFDSPAIYQLIKDSDLLNIALVSKLFALDKQDIIYCGFFDQAMAFKATIPRMRNGQRTASGGYMENDVHGSGQYLPLMHLKLPVDLSHVVRAIYESGAV